jgi:predicted Zn-dependent peptidase
VTAARPEVGRAAPFTLPAHDSLTFDNGMGATLADLGVVPKVHVELVLRAGAADEAAGETWLSRLVAEYLKEGTSVRSSGEFADAVAALGGRLRVDAGDDTTRIGATVLSDAGPELVRLLAELLREPLLPESELERLRGDQQRELGLALAEPSLLTRATFHRALYGEHPYGRVLPDATTIEGFDIGAVRGFVEGQFGAARAHLYVAGRFDAPAMAGAVRDAFDGWNAGEPPRSAPPPASSERLIHLVDRPGAEQSTLYIGLPVPDPSHEDYDALLVTNALLGGAFISRITTNIREDKGYTYSPRSAVSVRHRDAYWAQLADVTTVVTGPSLHEIFGEIDRLRAEPPPPEELEAIQNFVAGAFLLRNATPNGVIEQLAFLDLHGLDESYAAGFVERVYALTPDDVQRIAVDHLRPEEMTIAVAGDRKAIEEQLGEYGEIVEERPGD